MFFCFFSFVLIIYGYQSVFIFIFFFKAKVCCTSRCHFSVAKLSRIPYLGQLECTRQEIYKCERERSEKARLAFLMRTEVAACRGVVSDRAQ